MATIYYLGVRFSSTTNDWLMDFREQNKCSSLPLPKLGFHSTIMYSKTSFEFPWLPLGGFPKTISSYDPQLFNTSFVLSFPCDWLYQLHAECLLNGAQFEHAHYEPHITIAEQVAEIPTISYYMPTTFPLEIKEIFYREYE